MCSHRQSGTYWPTRRLVFGPHTRKSPRITNIITNSTPFLASLIDLEALFQWFFIPHYLIEDDWKSTSSGIEVLLNSFGSSSSDSPTTAPQSTCAPLCVSSAARQDSPSSEPFQCLFRPLFRKPCSWSAPLHVSHPFFLPFFPSFLLVISHPSLCFGLFPPLSFLLPLDGPPLTTSLVRLWQSTIRPAAAWQTCPVREALVSWNRRLSLRPKRRRR